MELRLSQLSKTWILDLDGTLVIHNGYKTYGMDKWLTGSKEFLLSIPEKDMIIFVTSREKSYARVTEQFLRQNGIRYDYIIYDAPYGERILLNDKKPSGLQTAYAVNCQRDGIIDLRVKVELIKRLQNI